MKDRNTKQWVRVFFILALISLLGIIWQWQRNHSTVVKVSGGSFSEGIIGTPRFINPVLAQSGSDKDLTQLIFSSLITQDSDGKDTYKLADSITISEDKKIYTLRLKNNLYFHDGYSITSEDVMFTIEKIQDPLIKSPLQAKWEGVEVEKVDTHTLKFVLDQEYSDFMSNFDIGILPKHIWENVGSDEFIFNTYNTKPIGSGSYVVKNINYEKSGIPRSYLLEKSKHSSAYIDQIELFFFDNENELIEAYRDGKIEAAYGLSANQENRDLFENEFSSTNKLPRIFGLFFNQNKQSLLKDKNIRSLIDNAINRQTIIDTVFAGYAYPIDGPLGNTIQNKEYEVKKYLESIEKSGWSKNEQGIYAKEIDDTETLLSIDLSTPNTDELTMLAENIKAVLLNHGVQINIRIFDEGNLHQKVIRPRDYEILLFGYMIEKETDLYAFWHSSQKNDPGLNISLYSNSTVDRELEKLRKDKSLADLAILEKEIKNDVPAVFLYSPAFTYLLPESIQGEDISVTEKHNRFDDIENWYMLTRHVWNIFIDKEQR